MNFNIKLRVNLWSEYKQNKQRRNSKHNGYSN